MEGFAAAAVAVVPTAAGPSAAVEAVELVADLVLIV